jgi:hypothetical protein
MHGGNQSKAFLDSTLLKTGFYLCGDVYKSAASGQVKPEFFTVGFHSYLLLLFVSLKILLDSYILWYLNVWGFMPVHPIFTLAGRAISMRIYEAENM